MNNINYFKDYIIKYGLGGGFKNGDTTYTDACAQWQNDLLRKNGYYIKGNAWNLDNVDLIYNGYDGLVKPETFDVNQVRKFNKSASKNVFNKFDSKTLDKDKTYIVNMYYDGSQHQENAYNKGKETTGTHTGILTFENGQWVVTHNIHGVIHQDNFINLQGGNGRYGVTSIYSPNKANIFQKLKMNIQNLFKII